MLTYLDSHALKVEKTGTWHPVRARAMVGTFPGGVRCGEPTALTCGDLMIGRGESVIVVQEKVPDTVQPPSA